MNRLAKRRSSREEVKACIGGGVTSRYFEEYDAEWKDLSPLSNITICNEKGVGNIN